ncbi:hypothetical protein ACFZB9_23710 [Kitasatospora sp. NPDC008050]|uniref:hypothetical protein n=1 Tax=Kitasatospora sp. NPDC008050 TaxID=3364021 RepID=UPI0036EE37EA
MIITTTAHPTVLLGPGSRRIRVRCLARRGMLHSETEAVDHVRLSPGACFDLTGREETEAAWYVLRGPVALLPVRVGAATPSTAEGRQPLNRGDLLLAPRGELVHLHAGPFGAELLCLTLTPAAATAQLPPRRPDLRGQP